MQINRVSIKSALNITSIRKRFSDGTLTKKASLNAVASALDYGARTIIGFIIQPLMVLYLGDFGYGVWQVLDRSVGYISPATGRPTQALKLIIATRQFSTDYEEKRRHVGSAIAVWFLSFPILLILGGLLAWFIPNWLDTPATLVWPVRIATALLVLDMALVSLTSLPKSVLEGENLGYKRMGLSTLLVMLGGILTVVALYFEAGLMGIAAAGTTTTIITGLIFLQIARKQLPWFGAARPQFSLVRQFFGLSWWFQLWNFVMRAMRTGDVVLLGLVGSAELVTIYTFTRYVPETLINFITMIVFGIAPGLGGIIGSGNLKSAAKVRSEIMGITWLLSTAIGTTILLWNRSFIGLWVGDAYYAGALVNLLIVLMVTQFALIRNDANIIDLTLDMRDKVLIGFGSTVLSMAIGGVLLYYFDSGVAGLCVGIIVGRLILTLQYPRIVGQSLQVSLQEQIVSSIRPAFTTIAMFGLALFLAQQIKVSSWLVLVALGTATGTIALLGAFFIGLSNKTRTQLWKRLYFIVR